MIMIYRKQKLLYHTDTKTNAQKKQRHLVNYDI